MAKIDSDLIKLVPACKFPNGVKFRAAVSDLSLNYVFFCEDCGRVGNRWTYAMSETQVVTDPLAKEHLLDVLYRHAELHNSLCKRLEMMILENNPVLKVIYPEPDYEVNGAIKPVNNLEIAFVLDEERKKKPKRMIRPVK